LALGDEMLPGLVAGYAHSATSADGKVAYGLTRFGEQFVHGGPPRVEGGVHTFWTVGLIREKLLAGLPAANPALADLYRHQRAAFQHDLIRSRPRTKEALQIAKKRLLPANLNWD